MATMYLSKRAGLTRTRLWTNANTSSSFASQTVTLSQDMDNFDYLEIAAKQWTSRDDSTAVTYTFKVSDVKTCTSGKDRMNMGLVSYGDSYYSARYVRYVSDTQISFGAGYRFNNNSNNSSSTIPLYINGLK